MTDKTSEVSESSCGDCLVYEEFVLHRVEFMEHVATEDLWRTKLDTTLESYSNFHTNLQPLIDMQQGLIAFSKFVLFVERMLRPVIWIIATLAAVAWAITDGVKLLLKVILHIKGGL